MLREAIDHHQTGRLGDAERLYRSILEKRPNDADALHLLGVICHQIGNLAEAETLIKRAIAVDNKAALFHVNLGNVLKQRGKQDEAMASFRKALSLQPDLAEAHYNLANELYANNDVEKAVTHYTKALRTNPQMAEAHYNLGIALQTQDRIEEAISSYSRAVAIRPDHHNAHYNLGILFQEMERYKDAAMHYDRALKYDPGNANAHYYRGNAYLELDRYDTAEASFRSAIALRPDFADAHNDLSVALRKQGRTEDALASARRSLEITPGFAAYNNLGITYREDGRIAEAIENAKRAIALKPDSPDVQWNLALALLHHGELAPGWQRYECRALKTDSSLRVFPYPRWAGSPLKDKTLFIFAEQGIGDQIMFASLFPDIMRREPKHCIADCDPRLVPLFARSFPGVAVIPAARETLVDRLPAIDLAIPMGSLPMHLRPDLISFPQQRSFLVPDAEKVALWSSRFNRLGTGLKIGISWRGGKDASVRNLRSTTLAQWSRLFTVPGLQFVNLQYGDCAQELLTAKKDLGVTIHDWDDADPLKDLDGFAAQIAALDLVISVDNATVHMAGALGIPAWVLLPRGCDWRWMKDFEDSPWYSSVRLFRQQAHGMWGEVFEPVAESLRTMTPRALASGNNDCFLPPVKRSYLSATSSVETMHSKTAISNLNLRLSEIMQNRISVKTAVEVREIDSLSATEQSLFDRPIFILGVPRSGTSMVAGLLHECGAWAGKTVLGSPENPKGFYEHIVLRETMNKKILSSLNCDPLGVKALPEIDQLPDIPDLGNIVKQVIQAEGYTEDRPWLFKDPKLSLIWPILRAAFPSARWIIVRRKNEDIIRSCLNTHFMVRHSTDPLFWRSWIDEYLDRLDRLKGSGVWWREVWPHELASGDFGVLHQLINELDLNWNEQIVEEFILPGSWHASTT